MKRHTAGFWVVAVALVATFAAEPEASTEIAGDVFTAIGEFGGSVVVEITSGDEAEGG